MGSCVPSTLKSSYAAATGKSTNEEKTVIITSFFINMAIMRVAFIYDTAGEGSEFHAAIR